MKGEVRMDELAMTENSFQNIIAQEGAVVAAFAQSLDVRSSSKDTYKKAVIRFFEYLQERGRTEMPTRQDILDYKEYLRRTYAANTVNAYLCAIKQFFSYTADAGLYPNITTKVKKLKIPKDHKKDDFSAIQAKSILQSMTRESLQGKRDYAIINTMFRTGLRDIEVSRACIDDIRNRSGHTVLYVYGKGHDEADAFVILTPKTYEAILEYLRARKAAGHNVSGDSPLFAAFGNRNVDGHMTPRSISRIVKSTLVSAGYDSSRWTAHSLRHSAVSIALAGGASIIDAKDMARHENVETTMIYAHNAQRLAHGAEYVIDNVL